MKGECNAKQKTLFLNLHCRAASYIGGECRKYREKLMEKKIVRFIFQFQYKFYYITERNFGKLYFIRHN